MRRCSSRTTRPSSPCTFVPHDRAKTPRLPRGRQGPLGGPTESVRWRVVGETAVHRSESLSKTLSGEETVAGTRTGTVPRQRSGTEALQQTPGRHARPEAGHDPGGRTDIDGNVVEKTAAHAARQVSGVHKVRTRTVRARVRGRFVLLRLKIAVRYPEPVRQVTDRVREHVRERVEHTTGKQVHHIDIEIVEMVRS